MSSLRLPLSGWILQWRASDQSWRELSAEQLEDEAAGRHVPSPDDWAAWTGDAGTAQGRCDDARGARSWWLIYGEVPGEADIEVVLADGSHPPIQRIGRLWAAEWSGPRQTATGRVGTHQVEMSFPRPQYRDDEMDHP